MKSSKNQLNIKAENYLNLANWIENGGLMQAHDDWQQLTWIKYKVNSDNESYKIDIDFYDFKNVTEIKEKFYEFIYFILIRINLF